MNNPANLLISWPYWNSLYPTIKDATHRIRLLIDSGAFTNYHKGQVTSVAEYIAFIRDLPVEPWGYFQLDVIGDPVATMANLETMLDAGLTPIPVFTRGAAPEHLERMYETSHLVGLGSLVGSNGALAYLKWAMEDLVRGRPLHWLGVQRHDWICHYRPTSVDGSTWGSAGMYGCMYVYLGKGRLIKMLFKDTAKITAEVQAAITRHGFDWRELADPDVWHRRSGLHIRVTTRALLAYQADVRRQLGTEVFMVSTSSSDTRLLATTMLERGAT